jgi:hypothetical protein
MKLHCPSCGRPIRADDINLATSFAKCRACNSVFDFRDSVRNQEHRAGPDGPPVAPLLPRSTRIKIEDFAGVLRLRWRWFSPSHVAAALFCVVWDSFLVCWYTAAFTRSKGVEWMMVLFPVIHVTIGVSLTYATLCGFFNSTTIEVGFDELRVRHGPLPWAGNRQFMASAIVQLHCEEKKSRNKDSTTTDYQVWATLENGRKVRLVSGLIDLAEARLIEQEIERRLNIDPRRVVGECTA